MFDLARFAVGSLAMVMLLSTALVVAIAAAAGRADRRLDAQRLTVRRPDVASPVEVVVGLVSHSSDGLQRAASLPPLLLPSGPGRPEQVEQMVRQAFSEFLRTAGAPDSSELVVLVEPRRSLTAVA